ncbi:Uncharacterised protein [Vibrio cholerae]|nr:Uncharacterised protein [Vibrio cholerae]
MAQRLHHLLKRVGDATDFIMTLDFKQDFTIAEGDLIGCGFEFR